MELTEFDCYFLVVGEKEAASHGDVLATCKILILCCVSKTSERSAST
jgi:hypothetical protein